MKSESPDATYAAEIRKAREEIKAGKTVPYEEVRRWLLSWGTEKGLPRPKCK